MSVQNTYNTYHGEAYAGMVADGQLCNTVTKVNAGSSTVAYGKFVITAGEDGFLVASGDLQTERVILGVLKRELNHAYADGDTFGVPVDRDGTVVTQGPIWVTAQATVAKDDPVYVITALDATAGDVTNVAGTTTLLVNAKFLTGGNAGDLVKITINSTRG